MMKEDYSKLKEKAGDRGEWRAIARTNLPRKAQNHEVDNSQC